MSNFDEDLAFGQLFEDAAIVALNILGWECRAATRGEQRRKIDIVSPHGTLDVKACRKGHRTGNAFIETISVVDAEVPGWLFTSQADWILYVLTVTGRGLLLRLATLRARRWAWEVLYPTMRPRDPTRGKGELYHSEGICVPLRVVERDAEAIIWMEVSPATHGQAR